MAATAPPTAPPSTIGFSTPCHLEITTINIEARAAQTITMRIFLVVFPFAFPLV